jgi:hypothetical protein
MKRGWLVAGFIVALGWFVLTRTVSSLIGGLGALLVAPHVTIMLLGVVFNIVGLFYGAGWPAITAGILYCVAIGFALPLGEWLLIPGLAAGLCFMASKREVPPTAPQVVHIVHHYEDGRVSVEQLPSDSSQSSQPDAPVTQPTPAPADKNQAWVMAFRVAVVLIGFLLIVLIAAVLSNR